MPGLDAELQAMFEAYGNAVLKLDRSHDSLNAKVKESAGPSGGFSMLKNTLEGVSKGLLGTTGIVAGFYAAGKALESFAVASVQLQSFAKDTGFAASNVQDMQQAMRRMGLSMSEANTMIGTLGGKLNNLAAFKEGSELYKTLSQSQGGTTFANRLLELVRAGNQMGAVNEVIRTFSVQTREAKIALSEYFGVPISVLEDYSEASKRGIEVWRVNAEEAKKYHNMWVDFEVEYTNIYNRISDHGIQAITKLTEAFKIQGVGQNEVVKFFSEGIDNAVIMLKQDIQDIKDIMTWWEGAKAWFGSLTANPSGMSGLDRARGEKYGSTNGPDYGPTGSMGGKGSGTAVADAGAFLRGPDHPSVLLQNLATVEGNSNILLREISDTLRHMDEGGRGGGTGAGPPHGIGIRSTGGQAQAGMGGFRPVRPGGPGAAVSSGGSGGITAPAGTPIQHSGEFVTTPDGKKFEVDPKFKDNFQGFIDDYYKAGGTMGSATATAGVRPNNASGHPILDAIDVNQVGRGVRGGTGKSLPPAVEDALADKWGMVSGNKWKDNDQGHFGIRSMKAARDALVANGVTPAEAEKKVGLAPGGGGPAVKGSWFTDHSTASGADASKVPGIALPTRAGLGKMHNVTGPDGVTTQLKQIDIGPAAWTGRGIDFSGPAKDKMGFDPTDKKFTYSLADENRTKIDKAQGGGGTQWGGINASVEFLNVPPNVRTQADTEGQIFKNVQINRTKQAGTFTPAGGGSPAQSYE